MKISPFSYENYKTYLSAAISASQPSWGAVSRVAEAGGCQRAYLSRVLNGDVHLTPDHAHGIAEHFALTEAESEYFFSLVELGRAATAAYKKRLNLKLAKLRREQEDLQKKVNRPKSFSDNRDLEYYSAWYFSALHIIVSIPKYQTAALIAERLQISINVV
jgi:uncharacterized protein (TIGR02147 family)